MEDIKGFFIKLLVIITIIVIPVSILATLTEWFVNAIKWIVFIDNAETGLPMIAEYIIKGIVEAIILAIAGILGIKEKNPIIAVVTIIFGFILCVIFYFIAKYIIWILIALTIVLLAIIIYYIIKNKRSDKDAVQYSN